MVAGTDKHRSVGRSSMIKMRSVLGQALNFAVKRAPQEAERMDPDDRRADRRPRLIA